jgi:hypothetical protein
MSDSERFAYCSRWQGWLAIGITGLIVGGSYWFLVKEPWDSNRLLARAIRPRQ